MRQLIIVSATAASLRLTTRIAVLAGQFEVGVYCIQAARLAQLLEVITDQAGGQAFGHPAIGEVAVPQVLGQHGLCLLLEQSAKFRLLDLGIGLVRVLEIAQDLAGTEFLEGIHVESFQAQDEGRWQGLPAEVAAQHPVRQPAGKAGETVQQRLQAVVRVG